MKNKFIIILFLCILICFIIYSIYKDNKIYYIALGEVPKDQYRYEYQDYVSDYLKKEGILGKFNKNFLREDYTTEEFLEHIKNAKTSVIGGKSETLTASIRESNLITISMGNNEIEFIINKNYKKIVSKETYKSIDKMIDNYKEIIKKIRYLSSSPIIIVGYFNTFDFKEDEKRQADSNLIYEYAEERLSELLIGEDIYIVKLFSTFNEEKEKYTEILDKVSPSIEGYKYMADKIINIYNLEINT